MVNEAACNYKEPVAGGELNIYRYWLTGEQIPFLKQTEIITLAL